MSDNKKTVFRDKALRLYLKNQQKIVFFKLVQPRLFPYFWVLLGGLAVIVVLTWSARVPITVTGVGFVTGFEGAPLTAPGTLILLLPPESLGQLRPQQRVLFRNHNAEPVLAGRIARVEPTVLSPDVIRSRFALSGTLSFITGPAAVAIARMEAEAGGLPVATYAGGSSSIDIEIGSRRVLSLIPGLNSLFEARFH